MIIESGGPIQFNVIRVFEIQFRCFGKNFGSIRTEADIFCTIIRQNALGITQFSCCFGVPDYNASSNYNSKTGLPTGSIIIAQQ